MKQLHLLTIGLALALLIPLSGVAQVSEETLTSISTPTKAETRIGTFEFKGGALSKATLDKVCDNLDFTHAQWASADNLQGVSTHTIRKGLQSIGVKDNEAIIFSQLMDTEPLWPTNNADTIYVVGALDLNKGPMVLETAPGFLGAVQGYWFRWVTDIGLPGSDRREGGKYLIVPPGYDGPLPEGGFSVARARTDAVLQAWRA